MNEFWSLITVIGCWGWILAIVGLIVTSFPGKGVFRRDRAARWGVSFLLLYTVWIVGMTKA